MVLPVSDEVIDLHRALEKLTPRQRQLIDLRFQQEMTLAEAGEVLGVSGARVRQIEQGALIALRRAMRRKRMVAEVHEGSRELSFADQLREYGKHREAVAKADAERAALVAARQTSQRAAMTIAAQRSVEERLLAAEAEWRRLRSVEDAETRAAMIGRPFKEAWGEGVVIRVVEAGVSVRWNNYPAAPLAPVLLSPSAVINVGPFLARSLCGKGFAEPLTDEDHELMWARH